MAANATSSGDFLVNQTTDYNQTLPSVTVLDDGGWVVAWSTFGQDASNFAVFQRRFDKFGHAVGDEQQVNTYETNQQDRPSISALTDGGWVVVWHSYTQDTSEFGVYMQRYAADGTAVGGETLVNTTTADSQEYPTVAGLGDGGWVVSWKSNLQDGSGFGIYQQRYNSDGTTNGGEYPVNTVTDNNQWNPQTIALPDGGWLVVYSSYLFDGSGWAVAMQRYDSGGTKSGGEVPVNTVTLNDQVDAKAAALKSLDGGWVISWTFKDNVTGEYDIHAQQFDRLGNKVGVEITVNTTTASNQSDSAVVALKDGGWVIAWQSQGQDGDDMGIFLQRYSASGNKVGTETQVNAYTDNAQSLVSMASTKDGGWVVTWQSTGQDGSSEGIYSTHFAVDRVGTNASEKIKGTAWGETVKARGGDDVILAGAGNDTETGGRGNDRFVFKTGWGKDTLTDFDGIGIKHDMLDIRGLAAVTSWIDLLKHHLRQVGDDVVIKNLGGGDKITLLNVDKADLDANDFVI